MRMQHTRVRLVSLQPVACVSKILVLNTPHALLRPVSASYLLMLNGSITTAGSGSSFALASCFRSCFLLTSLAAWFSRPPPPRRLHAYAWARAWAPGRACMGRGMGRGMHGQRHEHVAGTSCMCGYRACPLPLLHQTHTPSHTYHTGRVPRAGRQGSAGGQAGFRGQGVGRRDVRGTAWRSEMLAIPERPPCMSKSGLYYDGGSFERTERGQGQLSVDPRRRWQAHGLELTDSSTQHFANWHKI